MCHVMSRLDALDQDPMPYGLKPNAEGESLWRQRCVAWDDRSGKK
jgi:hypothetical protein